MRTATSGWDPLVLVCFQDFRCAHIWLHHLQLCIFSPNQKQLLFLIRKLTFLFECLNCWFLIFKINSRFGIVQRHPCNCFRFLLIWQYLFQGEMTRISTAASH